MQGSLKFNDYLGRWGLTPDGDPIVTHSSQLFMRICSVIPTRRQLLPRDAWRDK
jgi:streptomycin 6-kinase